MSETNRCCCSSPPKSFSSQAVMVDSACAFDDVTMAVPLIILCGPWLADAGFERCRPVEVTCSPRRLVITQCPE